MATAALAKIAKLVLLIAVSAHLTAVMINVITKKTAIIAPLIAVTAVLQLQLGALFQTPSFAIIPKLDGVVLYPQKVLISLSTITVMTRCKSSLQTAIGKVAYGSAMVFACPLMTTIVISRMWTLVRNALVLKTALEGA